MLLLLLIIVVIAVIYNIYFYLIGYRRRSVKGDVVLITGGGGGLGRMMAVEFGKLGANLVLWDMSEPLLKEAKAAVEATGATCSTYVIDITDREKVYAVAKQIGKVDVLINNAGIVSGKPFLECTDEQCIRTMNVNCIAHFWTLRAFLPGMIERKKGHVTSIASVAGSFGVRGLVDYCASKFGAVGLQEALMMEMREKHPYVGVTTIQPYYLLGTALFAGIKSPIVPLVDAQWMANRTVEATLRGEERVMAPFLAWLAQSLKLFPMTWYARVSEILGTAKTMDSFVGNKKSA